MLKEKIIRGQKSFIPRPIYFINTDYASKEKPLNEKTRNIL